MAQVYSIQLAAHASYIGTLDVLVPPGYKLVVRDIDLWHNASSAAADFQFLGNIPNQILWLQSWAAGAFGFGQWRGRQVFETGQLFQIIVNDSGGAGVSFQVSGYQLSLP